VPKVEPLKLNWLEQRWHDQVSDGIGVINNLLSKRGSPLRYEIVQHGMPTDHEAGEGHEEESSG
jgi:hypothetical protein